MSGIPPQIVPDHQLLRRIGGGSYGEVWLARNVMGTYRAIKVVYRQTFDSERPYEREFNGIKRFEPVSRSHDSLVDILQVGTQDAAGCYYYVMELGDDRLLGPQINPETYEAKTLGKELATRGRLSFGECVQIGLSLAAGLEHLHQHGLIHRDVKPSNIIFVNGLPKIADIGLVAEAGSSRSFVGTEGFIPPEGPGTPQADVYSLGKVLYEISSGKDRQTFPELPTRLDELTDQQEFLELNAVILKACAVDPRRRYHSAQELYDDLLLLQAGKSVKRLRVLEQRLAWFTKAATAAALLIAVASGVYYQTQQVLKRETALRAQKVGYTVDYGRQLTDQGDLFGALPWFAEALTLVRGHPHSEELQRIRIATVLQQCPKISRLFLANTVFFFADLSPDGQFLAAVVGSSNSVDVWNLATSQKYPLIGLTSEVHAVYFNPSSTLALTASMEGDVCLWDIKSGEQKKCVHYSSGLNNARFDAQGSRIITAAVDGSAQLWNGPDWREAGPVFMRHDRPLRDAALSPDGRLAVTASEDFTAQIWDLHHRQRLGVPLEHGSWVYQASFSPDGRYVLTSSFDRSARVWDVQTGLQIRRWQHNGPVYSAQFSPDGHYILAGGWEDHTAQIWDFDTWKERCPPLRHSGNIMQATFCFEGRFVLTANYDQTLRLWDLAATNWIPPIVPRPISLDGLHYATLGTQTVQLRPLVGTADSKPLCQLSFPPADVLLNQDGSRMLVLSYPVPGASEPLRQAQLWDGFRGKPLNSGFAFAASLTNQCLSDDGNRLLLHRDDLAELRDPLTGQSLAQLTINDPIQTTKMDEHGRRVVLLGGSNAVLWSWESASTSKKLVLPHDQLVRHAAFSPNGRHLATACNLFLSSIGTCNAHVWDTRTGRRVGSPLPHADDLLHVAFDRTGERIITSSEDRNSQIWRVTTGQRLGPILRHNHQVAQAAFSADGRLVLTACMDGSVRVWDSETGEPLTPSLNHPNVLEARFLPQGRQFLTLDKQSAWHWDLAIDPLLQNRPASDLNLIAQLLSGHHSVQAGGAILEDPQTMQTHWCQLRDRFSGLFVTTADESHLWQQEATKAAIHWHEQEARKCEATHQWFAAQFHLERLSRLQPARPDHHWRQAHAAARWSQTTRNASRLSEP